MVAHGVAFWHAAYLVRHAYKPLVQNYKTEADLLIPHLRQSLSGSPFKQENDPNDGSRHLAVVDVGAQNGFFTATALEHFANLEKRRMLTGRCCSEPKRNRLGSEPEEACCGAALRRS